MEKYKKYNLLFGWLVFFIAAVVYFLTLEPTVSFWDCGEYISTAYKLEVGHPPGAPLFQLIGRFFSLFTTDTTNVAFLINCVSALSSAFTIMFLFWTITMLTKKILSIEKHLKTIIGCGLVGALAYTFSDSFWFSAVESEVYAMSSLFTALTFWSILKWEEEFDKPYAWRWIILIAYLIGLSIGVHLLNLLAIPALVMVYSHKTGFNKKFKYSNLSGFKAGLIAFFICIPIFIICLIIGSAFSVGGITIVVSGACFYSIRKWLIGKNTAGGAIVAFMFSILLLGTIQSIIIPGIVSLAGKFEIFFVNTIGLPFNYGTIIYFIFLTSLIVFGIRWSQKNNKPLYNNLILCFLMILIGYSTFFTLVIRSNANTPIDENNPEDAVSLLSYLNREQYGSWPIVHGQYYNAQPNGYKEGKPKYTKDLEKKKYIKEDDKYGAYTYPEDFLTFFPRMWSSSDPNHVGEYEKWGMKGEKTIANKPPTYKQNLRYFVQYQVGHMYFRYFMWNFAGKQNNIQGRDYAVRKYNGNWISGIPFLDNARLGDQNLMPDHLKNNKAKNKYFLLPLILGIIGAVFHCKKNKNDFAIVSLLFILTGLAIVIYLNQYPLQPRERDYAYVGSFYAFSIWIGFGVAGIKSLIDQYLSNNLINKNSGIISTLICLLCVPGLMAKENWDDHDRSDKYTARETAINYLNSCAPNAILFTNGDNDTFPLWYAQEVEGIRTDIRVVNLSLFNTEWYIDQMKRKAYLSDPIPGIIEKEDYKQGTRDYLPISIPENYKKKRHELNNIMKDILSDKTKTPTNVGEITSFPTRKLKLTISSENKKYLTNYIKNNWNLAHDSSTIVNEIRWKLLNHNYNSGETKPQSGVQKNEMMVLDIIAANNWERPIYFALTIGKNNFMDLENYLQLEGLAYRLMPTWNIKHISHDINTNADIFTCEEKEKIINSSQKNTTWVYKKNGQLISADNLPKIAIYNGQEVNTLNIKDSLIFYSKKIKEENIRMKNLKSQIKLMSNKQKKADKKDEIKKIKENLIQLNRKSFIKSRNLKWLCENYTIQNIYGDLNNDGEQDIPYLIANMIIDKDQSIIDVVSYIKKRNITLSEFNKIPMQHVINYITKYFETAPKNDFENKFTIDKIQEYMQKTQNNPLGRDMGSINNSTLLYDNIMNKFIWNSFANTDVYMEEQSSQMAANFTNVFARLANKLIEENKMDSAKAVLDKFMEVLPEENFPYTIYSINIAEAYLKIADCADCCDKSVKILDGIILINSQESELYKANNQNQRANQCIRISNLAKDIKETSPCVNEEKPVEEESAEEVFDIQNIKIEN